MMVLICLSLSFVCVRLGGMASWNGVMGQGAAAASASFAESRAPNVQEHQKRVVVAGGETASTKRITGSSEYQLQFSWPAGKQSRRMPESLDSLLSHGNKN